MSRVRAALAKTEKGTKSLSIFESEYGKLNPQQKQAVDTVEGPVMVVAGPGTGKTQVVSLRVANILKKTQMRPSNILCLTFSVSGATAMRDRLRLLIGADAYSVTVNTIHAFAHAIIEQNPMAFEDFAAKRQISDLERVRELNTIIDQLLPHIELLNPKDPYGRTMDILSRIGEVKREGKSLEDLERAAKAFDGEMKNKSKEGTKVHQKNLAAARKFHDFFLIFQKYQEMMTRTGRYDFDDMILHVIAALQEEDWLLMNLQERYQYILVDEFQDTNGAQLKLIELLTTYESLPHEPNLFIVGDDDQAIYRFQGANLQNMLSFHQRFPKAPVIALTTSYRSTQQILDAARSLIERNEERLVGKIPGLQKILASTSSQKGIAPVLLRSPSDTAEPWMIADLIDERLKAGTNPEEIAVLTQTNRELYEVFDVLRARGIAVILRGKEDLLSHPLVLQALTILNGMEDLRSEARLTSALACACFGVHSADLGLLHGLCREKKIKFFDLLTQMPADITLVDRAALVKARDTLLDLQYKIASRTVLETVEHVLRDCRIISAFAEGADSPVDPRDPAALDAFFSYVKNRCLEHPSTTFHDLLSDLRFMSDPESSQVRLRYELPHLTTSGIRLMTAHQSKGLEFAVVILTNFRDGHWDKRRTPSGVALPEHLIFGWDDEQKKFEKHQDERRVAFVAMTRAKRELVMTCPRELAVGEKTRMVAPSAFFAEMGTLTEEEGVLNDPEDCSLLLRPKAKVLDGALKGFLEERLKTFALSPTALNRFLRDPQEFLLVDLLQQPEHFDEKAVRSLGYGSAMHWALRQWAVSRQEGKESTVAEMLEAFAWYLRERTILTENQRRDLLALGRDALPLYHEQRLAHASPVLHAIERDYRSRLSDIPLKGKIDRIDLASVSSARATVIDYKAGKAKSESEIRGGIDAGNISRTEDGAHFRQLVFYSILLEHADPLLKPEEFVLDYIGERGEHPLPRSFVIRDEEKEDLQTLIHEIWQKIIKLDFSHL